MIDMLITLIIACLLATGLLSLLVYAGLVLAGQTDDRPGMP
jgi:hypothetical protein